jgi:uncharacterized membrane protein YkvA (DUF1232 family)
MLKTVLTVVVVIAALYAVTVAAIWWYARSLAEPANLREAARFGPELLRLVRRMLSSGDVSRGSKAALVALALYLVMPIDLVPDFIPVIGWADDVVIVVLVLRAVVRRTGSEIITRNWSGGSASLSVLLRLLRLG